MPYLDVQWLLPDGAGGGPFERGTARIDGVLPGDRVRFSIDKRRGRTVFGALEEVVAPSPERREPSCPWQAACGGCDLAALQPEARRSHLARVVQRALRLDAAPDVVPSPRDTGHRARIKLALQDGEVGYRAPRSHDLVAIGTCAVARAEVQAALARLRAWLERDPQHSRGLQTVEIRSDGSRSVFAFASKGRVPASTREALPQLGDVALDGQTLGGTPTLHLDVAGLSLRASPLSFYQVNLEQNAQLVNHVLDCVAQVGPDRVLDLYAGLGNLTLPIAAKGLPIVAVEREGQATADLKASAAAAGLTDGVTIHTADVARYDTSREAFDFAVIDPPRAGAPDVLPRLLLTRPRALLYVSCHAPSAGRDLRSALDAGYQVDSVRCFDLFVDTHHIETVILLSRPDSRP